MQDLLDKAQPLNEAVLTRVKPQAKLKDGQLVRIKSKPRMIVCLKGAVEQEGEVSVPKGSRLKDLKEWVVFKNNANVEKLETNRRLKENEIIEIEYQKH